MIDLNTLREMTPEEKLRSLTEAIGEGASAVIIVFDRNGTSSFTFNSTGYEARRAVADTAVALDEHFRAHIRKQVKEADGK
jgi:hypothetical protein